MWGFFPEKTDKLNIHYFKILEKKEKVINSTYLVMVAGTRTTICSTRCLYLWRSFHRTCRITIGGRNWDSWVGSMMVVVVMLKMVAMLLKATCVWMS